MQLLKRLLIDFRQELTDLVGTRKRPAKAGMRVTRVAAKLGFRRFFQHDDSRRARLFCRHRGFESGATAADNNDRYGFSSHPGLRLSKVHESS